MITIRRISLREIRLSLVEPFTISSGTQDTRRITLLEVEDADGFVGWGECVASEYPNYMPETIDTAWMAIEAWIAPRVLGRGISNPTDVFALLRADIKGHLMAKAAVEMSVWELTARKRGLSLSRLLGGTRDRIEVGRSIGIQTSVDTLIERVQDALDEGYRRIKMKIRPGADAVFVKAVRNAVGTRAPLMVDANSAYRLSDAAVFKEMDNLGLMMFEQPLAWDDMVRHSELQKQLKTPICLDESITGVERAEDMVKLCSGRIINIKPARVGGFAPAVAIHDYCREHSIPVWCGGMLESGIGRAHNVALASLPNFTIPGDTSPSRRYWERDIVRPEWEMGNNGIIKVPMDTPGMGVEIDIDRVENLTVRTKDLRM
ncbi:MAG: o-succinylbenzoate synthase [Dehalococcoidia bacterium]